MHLIPDTVISRVKYWEGLYLRAYMCPGGVWTIGYGHTRGVRSGMVCTEQQADLWLREDLGDAAGYVDKYVTVPLTVNQRGALASFVFNIGVGSFRQSSLLTELNRGNYAVASEKFGLYVKSGGVVLPGLVKRRAGEREIFDTPVTDASPLVCYSTICAHCINRSQVTDASPLVCYSTKRLPNQDMVKRVQEMLSSLSLYDGAIDGIPGSKTSSGIERLFGFRLTGDPIRKEMRNE